MTKVIIIGVVVTFLLILVCAASYFVDKIVEGDLMKYIHCSICKCNECKRSCNCGICYQDDSRMRKACDRVEYKEVKKDDK